MSNDTMISWNKKVMAVLIIVFTGYNFLVYRGAEPDDRAGMSRLAIQGQQLYQEYNCTACHQLYGLGGYLGPDLTNIISAAGKGPHYVRAFLNSGFKSMPRFNFSEEEKDAIVEYLSLVDKTGYFPNYEAEIKPTGWVKIKEK